MDAASSSPAEPSSARQKRRRLAGTPHKARPPPSDPDAYTIDTFCERHGLSHSFYYKLKAQGLGPREIKLNSKVLISREAAADWRREREAEAAKQQKETT